MTKIKLIINKNKTFFRKKQNFLSHAFPKKIKLSIKKPKAARSRNTTNINNVERCYFSNKVTLEHRNFEQRRNRLGLGLECQWAN